MWGSPKRINPAKLNTWRGCGFSGARDRARTGDPHVGKRGGGVRSNAYLQLLLCEQRHIAAHSGIGDGSRLYPAPDLGRWAHPPPPMGVGLLWLVQSKNKKGA